MSQASLITITGHDRPGVTAALFECLPNDIHVLDVEQVVVDGLLTLGVLVTVPEGATAEELGGLVEARVAPLGLSVAVVAGESHPSPESAPRHSVTVLGHPLTGFDMARLAEQIAATGANIERIERIASFPVTALELSVSGGELMTLRRSLAELSHSAGIDIAVQAGGLDRRGRQLVVMDVDSTVIQDEVVELLAAKAGVGAEVKRITDAAMRGEMDFSQSLTQRVGLLAGLPESVFAEVYSELRLTPGARTLCRVLKSMDYHVALVSGGFSQVVEPLAQQLGVDFWRANELEVVDGRLTGRVLGKIVDRAGKAEALIGFAKATGIPMARTIAVGDGANDLDMLAAANLGIAFNAKPVVQASADAAVNVPYLDSVLFLLGVTRSEIEQFNLSRG